MTHRNASTIGYIVNTKVASFALIAERVSHDQHLIYLGIVRRPDATSGVRNVLFDGGVPVSGLAPLSPRANTRIHKRRRNALYPEIQARRKAIRACGSQNGKAVNLGEFKTKERAAIAEVR